VGRFPREHGGFREAVVYHSESEERAFYRRQAARLLELADGCKDHKTAQQLVKAAEYYIDKLEKLPPDSSVAA
jgi:hypothetical protein